MSKYAVSTRDYCLRILHIGRCVKYLNAPKTLNIFITTYISAIVVHFLAISGTNATVEKIISSVDALRTDEQNRFFFFSLKLSEQRY